VISEEELQQHKVRETDPDGRLLRSGLWWRERRPALSSAIVFGSGLLYLIAAGAAVLAVLAFVDGKAAGIVWAVAGLAAYAGARWLGHTGTMLRYFRRTVIFAHDGSIFVEHQPRGMHLYDCREPAALTKLSGKHPMISSIEMRQDDIPLEGSSLKPGERRLPPAKMFSVFIFFRDGQHYWSSMNLFEQEARWVVVQLTEALREIRESVAVRSPSRTTETL
jgi:hypothetical protein